MKRNARERILFKFLILNDDAIYSSPSGDWSFLTEENKETWKVLKQFHFLFSLNLSLSRETQTICRRWFFRYLRRFSILFSSWAAPLLQPTEESTAIAIRCVYTYIESLMSRLWDRVPASRLVCTCCKAPKKNVYMHLSAPFESLLAYFLFSVFLGRWKKRQLNHGRVSFSSSERHETDSTTMRPSRDDVREMHRIKPFKLNVTAIDHDSPLGEDKPSKYRIIQTQQFNVQSDTAIKSSYTEKSTFVVLPLLSLPPAHIYAPMKNKIGFNFINETPSQPFAASSHHHFFFTY